MVRPLPVTFHRGATTGADLIPMTAQTHFDDPRWDAEQESLKSFTDEDTEEDTDE